MRVITLTLGSGATQLTTVTGIYVTTMVVQNDSTADAAYMGDNTVTTSNGIYLAAGSTVPAVPVVLTFNTPRGSLLSQYYFIGTSSQTVTVLYETAQ